MHRRKLNTVGLAFTLPAARGRGEQCQTAALIYRLNQLSPETFSYDGEVLSSWRAVVEAAVVGEQTPDTAEAIGALIAAGCLVLDYQTNAENHILYGIPDGVERNLRSMLSEYASRDVTIRQESF